MSVRAAGRGWKRLAEARNLQGKVLRLEQHLLPWMKELIVSASTLIFFCRRGLVYHTGQKIVDHSHVWCH